jgi:hypothetical protein
MSDMKISTIDAATGEMGGPSVPARSGQAVIGAALAPRAIEQASILQRAFCFPAMLGALLVTGVYVARRGFDVDPDLWWHIKIGEGILATHHWPTSDFFSFTASGQPWIAAEWLGEVLFAAVARVGGLRGLEALLIILGATVMLALYAFATLRSGNSKAGFVTSAVLLVLAAANFNLRPQMLGYLFLVLTLIALERFRQGRPRALWFLPLLFLVWVNTHPSWEIGLGTMFVYWMSGLREIRLGGIDIRCWKPAERVRLSLAFLLCTAVLPITPYGARLAAFPFQFISSLPGNLANIIEWQPMPFNQSGPKLFLALILGLFAMQIAFRLTWRLEELALFFFGTAMACLHARFLLIFVPFFTPLFATILARWLPKYNRKKDQYLLNALLMFSMLAGMVRYFPSQAGIEESVASHFPVGAVQYLSRHPIPGPMFNAYNFGGYLVWATAPEHKVFIDGRGELFEPGGVFADYMHITLLKPGALSVLRAYGVQACLLDREQPLTTVLAALPDWQRVYSDQDSVLFVRRGGSEAAAVTATRSAPIRED